jgi:hypothetical protein
MMEAAATGTAIGPLCSKKRALAGGADSEPKRSEPKMAGGNPVGEYGYYQPHPTSITINVSGSMAGTMSLFSGK